MNNDPIVHIADDGRTHGLVEHLRGTAERAVVLRQSSSVRNVKLEAL